MSFFAENIVAKSSTNVHVKTSDAFVYAEVAFRLVKQRPGLCELIVGCFFESCPFTIPNYLEQTDYRKDIGYKEGENEETYMERMAGFVSLYAAFLQMPGEHPHGLDKGWRWLARVLNQPPCYATGTMLLAFLDIAGYEMSNRYKRQFAKLIKMIERDFQHRIPAKNEGMQNNSIQRIKIMLEKYNSQNGRINIPEGKIPARDHQHNQYQSTHRGGGGGGHYNNY